MVTQRDLLVVAGIVGGFIVYQRFLKQFVDKIF